MANCIRCGRTLNGFTFGKKICGWCKQHEAAQRGEDSQYQPVMTTPWRRQESMPMLVTQFIFGINVAVFIGMLLSGASLMAPTGADLLAWGANFGPYTLNGDWWRLLTSCFVHIGLIHIAFNMWCLWSLGGLAERLYGHYTFACVYLLCGVAGSLGSLWWHRMPMLSAGASGAIFGIAGAVIASIKLGEFSSAVMAQSTMRSLIAFVGYNVVFGMISGGNRQRLPFWRTGRLGGAGRADCEGRTGAPSAAAPGECWCWWPRCWQAEGIRCNAAGSFFLLSGAGQRSEPDGETAPYPSFCNVPALPSAS